nr:transposase (putative), gypsy type [Tanacetum cinerariifolium]
MGRDTVQLETAVNTISQEYLLEFTSDYGIPKATHPELPSPEDRIVDFPEGKVGVYTKFFEFANFYLPLSQFLFDILGYYQIHLSQLSVIGAAKNIGYTPHSHPKTARGATLLSGTKPQKLPEGRDMDLFSLIYAPNPTKVKTRSRPHAAHEVPLLTVTANRVIEMEDPTAATNSSGLPVKIERSPLDFANEARDEDQGTMTPEVPLLEDVPTTRCALEAGQAKGVAATELGMGSTRPAPVPESLPADVSDPDPLSFAGPQSHHPADVAHMLDTPEACQDLVDHVAPPGYFLGLRHLHNDDFLRQYNVNLARQVAMGSQLRLRFKQEAKLLKKLVAQVAHRDKRIQAREHEIKNLEALLEADADMKKAAEDKKQVSGEEKLKAVFEEFKRYEDNRVEQRCAEMDARLDAMSIDFDEELYPHMLTAIAGRRWMIAHGLCLAVVKCSESLELRQAFTDVVLAGIGKVMSEGLRHGALKILKYPLVDQLEGLKDAPMDVIMLPYTWKVILGMMLHNGYASSVPVLLNSPSLCTRRVGSAHHARSDCVPVSVPTVVPQGLAILLADAATQTESDEAILNNFVPHAPWESLHILNVLGMALRTQSSRPPGLQPVYVVGQV